MQRSSWGEREAGKVQKQSMEASCHITWDLVPFDHSLSMTLGTQCTYFLLLIFPLPINAEARLAECSQFSFPMGPLLESALNAFFSLFKA
jgi:hypothetical protein